MSHALVIGGSITGLSVAQVLLKHYGRVTLVERDKIPAEPEGRPGVPQCWHVHALLLEGYRVLETLFPGLTRDLIGRGALLLDWTSDWRFLTSWDWMTCEPAGLRSLICSRFLLEWYLRNCLIKNPRFELRSSTQVTGLIPNSDKTQIIGVEVVDGTTIAADFVADASGRNSRLPNWLVELGYERPQETVVNSFLGYASRWYRCPSDTDPKGIVLTSKYGVTRRGGVLYPVENNCCIVTLSGVEQDYPPSDEDDFLSFAKSLRDPSLAAAIQKFEPISPIYCFRRTENRWLHYEKLSSMPRNLVVLGDAVCMFNPTYGQGMTVAAQGAQTLDACLKRQKGSGLKLDFQKKLSRQIQMPWLMATNEDFRWDMTTGQRPSRLIQLIQKYFDRVIETTSYDPSIQRTFLEVAHLAKSPIHLFHPYVSWKALFGSRTASEAAIRY